MIKRYSAYFASIPFLVASLALSQAKADVTLPKVIDSHMVLQRDRPLPIWGWADPGENVTVKFDETLQAATADSQGDWKVVLPAVKADGKAHHMTIGGKNKIELDDILIGEVWIGSGQSNMEMGISLTDGAKEEIASAEHPEIRLLLVPKAAGREPAKDVKAQWVACTPKTVAAGGWSGFSAALYYFGSKLHKELNVPVGLIESAWGGQKIERFIADGPKQGDIYNGMIAPIKPFAIRGAIWYQGEANVGDGMAYADKMKDLIGGWRKVWDSDFSFYFVEIAPFAGYRNHALPALWEAQVASLKIPGTGMAETTDLVGNIKDIHPKDKMDVGNRLALWALAKNYGKDIVYSGPLLQVDESRRQQGAAFLRPCGRRPEIAQRQTVERIRDCRRGRKVRAGRGDHRRRHSRCSIRASCRAYPGSLRLARRCQPELGQQRGSARLAVQDRQLARRHG